MRTSFPVVGAGSNSNGTKYILFVAVAVGVIANVAVASFLIPGSAILSQPSPISCGEYIVCNGTGCADVNCVDTSVTENTPQNVIIAGDDIYHDEQPAHTPPPLPSIAEIKMNLISQSQARNKSLFYSGPGGYLKYAIPRSKEMGRYTWDDFFLDPQYLKAWSNAPASDFRKLEDNASAALAELSSEVVYVLLPNDTNGRVWFKGTVWARIEWPALLNNPAVTKIMRIDPDGDQEEEIYSKEVINGLEESISV